MTRLSASTPKQDSLTASPAENRGKTASFYVAPEDWCFSESSSARYKQLQSPSRFFVCVSRPQGSTISADSAGSSFNIRHIPNTPALLHKHLRYAHYFFVMNGETTTNHHLLFVVPAAIGVAPTAPPRACPTRVRSTHSRAPQIS